MASHAARRDPARQALVAAGSGVLVLLVVALAVARFSLHLHVAPVLTGSMRPAYAPGDAVVVRTVPARNVRPGMIIAVVPPRHTATYAHRVIAVTHAAGGRVIARTKGDANPAPDAWAVPLRATVPTVVASIPKLGYLLAGMQSHYWTQRLVLALSGLALTAAAVMSILVTAPAQPQAS